MFLSINPATVLGANAEGYFGGGGGPKTLDVEVVRHQLKTWKVGGSVKCIN